MNKKFLKGRLKMVKTQDKIKSLIKEMWGQDFDIEVIKLKNKYKFLPENKYVINLFPLNNYVKSHVFIFRHCKLMPLNNQIYEFMLDKHFIAYDYIRKEIK